MGSLSENEPKCNWCGKNQVAKRWRNNFCSFECDLKYEPIRLLIMGIVFLGMSILLFSFHIWIVDSGVSYTLITDGNFLAILLGMGFFQLITGLASFFTGIYGYLLRRQPPMRDQYINSH